MIYPRVMTEDQTLDAALAGKSLARFGDGELRLCYPGGYAASQSHDWALARELRSILAQESPALACIPNIGSTTPKIRFWSKFTSVKFLALYRLQQYGSSFVTRPDNAPWINRADYWAKVRRLWEGRDVTLVTGTERSLTSEMLANARSVREVHGPKHNAFVEVDSIDVRIGSPPGIVLLCLGATATILAVRLARRGVHAVDCGHVGMFMRRIARAAA